MITYKKLCTDTRTFDCGTSTLATLCEQQGVPYALMFLEHWQFRYRIPECGRIGGCVKREVQSYQTLLQRYHGVRIDIEKIANREQLVCAAEQHSDGCAVLYDTFWCPWCYNYQKEHQKHYSLVLGFDTQQQFHCCDTVPYSADTILPLDDLLKSDFYVVSIASEEQQSEALNYESKLAALGDTLLADGGDMSQLFSYAHQIGNTFSIEAENIFKGTNSWASTPFLIDLEWIARQRKAFAYAIQTLLELHQDTRLATLHEEMNQVADNWYNLFLSSWAYFLMPNSDSAAARIYLADTIDSFAKKEQTIAEKLQLFRR